MPQRGQLKAAKRGPVTSPLTGAAYRKARKMDPSSTVREGEHAVAARLGRGSRKKKSAAKKRRRRLAKLTSRQRAEFMVRTRERKSKKMGR